MNEQTKQDKSQPKSSVKDNPYTNSKTNQETEYFVAGPEMDDFRAASTKTLEIHELSKVFYRN